MFGKFMRKVSRLLLSAEPPKHECEVCLEVASLHRGRVCKKGGHEANRICINCLTTYVRTLMANENWDHLTCPFCRSCLRFRIVRTYVEPCLAYRYKAFLYSFKRARHENFQWCLNPDCHYGQVHDISILGNTMQCRCCGSPTCAFHQMPAGHYTGQTCEEFDADVNPYNLSGITLANYQREAAEAAMQAKSKRCPRCGVMIEKDGGCDT
ncbi:Ubiquitin-conjugating enzyme 7-interacting 4, partial [Hyphodiscus hymeniophilus]